MIHILHIIGLGIDHAFNAAWRLFAMWCLLYGAQSIGLVWVGVARKAETKNRTVVTGSILIAIGVLTFIVR